MVMDGNLRTYYYGDAPGTKLSDGAISVVPNTPLMNNPRLGNGRMVQDEPGDYLPNFSTQSEPSLNGYDPQWNCDPNEEYDFNDVVLKYISEILMEEDMEEKACMFQESAALQVAEKSFYEALGETYPPPLPPRPPHPVPGDHRVPDSNQGISTCDEYSLGDSNSSTTCSGLWCPNWSSDINANAYDSTHGSNISVDVASALTSQPAYSSSNSCSTVSDGLADSPDSCLRISDIFGDSESALQFKKGFEEASKFLFNGKALVLDFKDNGKNHNNRVSSMNEEKHESVCYYPEESRGRKNPLHDDSDMQRVKSNKQTAVYSESTVRSQLFDDVLLCSGGKNESDLRKALQEVASKSILQNEQAKGTNGSKTRGKKGGGKRKVVDLRTILTLCAQAVAADDRRTANEFLKQIRQHSDPTGDGMQRLASYLADGLEARMAGSSTQIYKALISMPTSAVDVLKAYQLFLAACPFRKLSNFFSNKTIWHAAEKASKLHIIDFGVLYGFQWPSLMQRLSTRPGGPPKLRITGIDFPNPGFRPAARVEETGRRLANYAETFGVELEFNAIAQKWETIKIEDLKIREDEVLVVNCLYRFRNLLDETVLVNSPRNTVLNLIKEIRPNVFILGIVNGAYNAPFFITRFREALFHYSSLFDMLEANIPREIHERMLIEKTIFGREAMNVIACEGAERIERPETYKQWQVRNLRAGFQQLPLNEEIMRMSRERVKSYSKDFVIDEDSQWMLQGWKGRIIYALSSWKPAD
ncbi:OLC1v1027604C1 [Oldenlandia corymbosa var. corymbosa]|uniref:OLC1v1027604C1 n=1 Tax=Oldenlandia corymbosa var. corymbosa TaxID=529605 RepID=A0AAV1CC48_OLDCO|nr:OLC1v1027604C1 [Oldenlandia corymbosa var. corymbosa]